MIWVVRSVPAHGATLSEPPRTVSLTFDKTPDPRLSHVSVRGPGAGAGDLTQTQETLGLSVTITQKGDYAVFYHVVFTDGSSLLGVVQFSLGTGTAPSPIPHAVVTEQAQAIAPEHPHGVDPVGAVLLFVNLLVVVVVAVLLRINRPGRQPVGWRLKDR